MFFCALMFSYLCRCASLSFPDKTIQRSSTWTKANIPGLPFMKLHLLKKQNKWQVFQEHRITHLTAAQELCDQREGTLDNDLQTGGFGGNVAEPGKVYFVATPIGNLGDMTLRAASILRSADVIASEDTRRTGKLLQHLNTGKKVQVSHHEHNWKSRVPQLVEMAREGKSIAVVSDAGTPGISDPGVPLAKACADEGIPVVPIPGACAAIAALSVSGFFSSEYVFFGFLPSKRGSARTAKISQVMEEERTSVFYEAPHRIEYTLQEMIDHSSQASLRSIFCARELTKMHEHFFRGTIKEALDFFKVPESKPRGEFTVILGPLEKEEKSKEQAEIEATAMLKQLILDEGMSTSMAVKNVSKEIKELKKSDVYDIALKL
mmetsp:Transcript_29204/g.38408  ORF Transcript_29204/g.38408 Transcript_29204/m.38408 type:complete len:377 (-) Transcript_29204:393-1523(-)